MKNKGQKISQAFQRWLLALVAIAFLTSTAFLWFSQTRLSEDNTHNLLKLNILDVEQDIKDLSDENLLKVTHRIAKELNKKDIYNASKIGIMAGASTPKEDINGVIKFLKDGGIK